MVSAAGGSPALPPRSDEGRRAARQATDRLTGLLLLATAGVVVVAAAEPIIRAVNEPSIPAARRGIAQALRAGGYAVGAPEPTGHPRIRGGALDPGRPPHGFADDDGGFFGLFAGGDDDLVIALRPLTLRDRADGRGNPVTQVPRGARVRILRELGDWVLLTASSGAVSVQGWVRRDELVTLP